MKTVLKYKMKGRYNDFSFAVIADDSVTKLKFQLKKNTYKI